MDLIQEYYTQKGYDYEFSKKLETKQRKIVSWQKKFKTKAKFISITKKFSKIRMRISQSSLYHMNISDIEDLEANNYSKAYSDALINFQNKCKDDVMCWRTPGYTPNLEKSAGPIEKFEYFENQIRKNFHKRYEEYFPDSTDLLEDVLNLMFQTVDNSFTKTIQVNSKQIKVLPEASAKYLNKKVSFLDQIQDLIEQDVKTCEKYSSLSKIAFGKTLQNHLKIKSKANDFKTRWLNYSQHTGHHKDLETFAAVWKNITHLQSTRKFCEWLANNPTVVPPEFLKSQDLLKKNLSVDFSATSDSLYDEYVTPQEIIEKRFGRAKQKPVMDASLYNKSSDSDSDESYDSEDISDVNIIV